MNSPRAPKFIKPLTQEQAEFVEKVIRDFGPMKAQQQFSDEYFDRLFEDAGNLTVISGPAW